MEASKALQVRDCQVHFLGRIPYGEALALQERLVEERAAGSIEDRLLLLEHPHVITMGRNSQEENVLVDTAHLAAQGVEVFDCGRGGDVTYHGPGQLVAYPILDLKPDRCDLHRYVRDLEQVMLRVLGAVGLQGHVVPGKTGVWVERKGLPAAKVGAIGVRVSRWVTSHGIALNVDTNLRYFDLIVPCGLKGSAVTSLAQLLPRVPPVDEVGRCFALELGHVFGRRMLFQERP